MGLRRSNENESEDGACGRAFQSAGACKVKSKV